MAFQPVPNTFQVAVRQQLFQQDVVNVLNFDRAGDPTAAELQLLCILVQAEFIENWYSQASSDLQLITVDARGLRTENDIFASTPAAPPTAGARLAAALPSSVAFCVKHSSALTGRSARGRSYLAGLCEDRVAQNVVEPAVITAALDTFNEIRTGAVALGFQFVIVSRVAGGVQRPVGLRYAVTNSTTYDNTVDSQRRRLTGRGR